MQSWHLLSYWFGTISVLGVFPFLALLLLFKKFSLLQLYAKTICFHLKLFLIRWTLPLVTPFCCCSRECHSNKFLAVLFSFFFLRKWVAAMLKTGMLLYVRAISTVSTPREACQSCMWTAAKQNTGAFPVKTSTLLQIEEKLTFWFGVFLQLRSNATEIVLKIISRSTFFQSFWNAILLSYLTREYD